MKSSQKRKRRKRKSGCKLLWRWSGRCSSLLSSSRLPFTSLKHPFSIIARCHAAISSHVDSMSFSIGESFLLTVSLYIMRHFSSAVS